MSMSNISKRRREGSRTKIKSMGDHKEFLKRITKTLYYGQLPTLPCLSLPVTEVSCELWSESQRGRSLRRLHVDAAADIARSACVSPCALVLAILYLERLNRCNPEYLATAAPNELFLVSLMVGNKFLQDDGEVDEVICSEWAASGGLQLSELKKLEIEFLNAIEWNVFVSEKSFEWGLSWLERQVALRQAQSRGYFTYGELAAGGGALAPPLRDAAAAAAAWLALTVGYLAALAACLALSHACLPAPRAALLAPDTRPPPLHHANDSADHTSIVVDRLLLEYAATGKLRCCAAWTNYHDSMKTKRNWYDGLIVNDWKSFEPWWSKTSVLNWLYQSSLINPLQRWLEKVNEFADLLKRVSLPADSWKRTGRCHGYVERKTQHQCVQGWLNLSKLGALVAAVSDR